MLFLYSILLPLLQPLVHAHAIKYALLCHLNTIKVTIFIIFIGIS